MKTENVTVGSGTEFPLRGVLTLPEGGGKCPAVVLVHGSGPSDMDERVGKLTPFRDIAEGLADRGVAALRYDKRTYAHAKKLRAQDMTVREETTQDAIRAAAMLKADERIDADRVFIVGHSMGAMLAPRIDAEGGDFRGLVLMAGTPFRLEDIVVRQLGGASKKGGILGFIVRLEEKLYGKKLRGLYEMSDEEARRKKFAGSLTLYYFKEMGRKTAADYLLESEKPALILQGGRDFQVLPEADFAEFKKVLEGRKNTKFRLFEGLNHLFVEAKYDDILKAAQEYSEERHVPGEVLDEIAGFVKES